MNEDAKWTLISIIVGLALTIIWTVLWEFIQRKIPSPRSMHDLEAPAASGNSIGQLNPDDVRSYIEATRLSPWPVPATFSTDQPLVELSQHHISNDAPQLPPLEFSGHLLPPMAHLPPPRI